MTTREFLESLGWPRCAYCRLVRATQRDHLITRNQARRLPRAAAARDDARYQVPSCADCNLKKYTRLLVPANMAALIPELEAITLGRYRTWDGASLPKVLR